MINLFRNDDLAWDRFWAARGEPYFEPASDRIMHALLEDNGRFAAYQRTGDLADIFPHISGDILASWDVGANLTGEWFNRITLGYGVKIGNNCNFLGHGGIEIGDNTIIGDDVNIITVSHPSDPACRSFLKVAPVRVGRNVFIGAGSIILNPGKGVVEIPDDTILPSNSLVYRSVNGINYTKMSPFAVEKRLQNNFQDFSGKVSMIPPLFVAVSKNNLMFSGGSAILNRHSKIVVPPSSTANVGNGFMAASRSNIIVGANASLKIASMVWVCAGAKILGPDNEKIYIGAGSIVAPGATASVDVPDNTIVINHNEFRLIRQENSDFPNDWLNTEWRDGMIMRFDRSLGRI
jgi:acetyltransferase-like isoleucine patch superfamily enzyme